MRTDERPGALEQGRLTELIRQLGSEFGWDASDLEPVRDWESRTSILYKLEGGDDPGALVLKVGKDWTVDKAREVYDDLRSLEDLFNTSDQVNINLPKVRGWSDSPPSVAFDFVEGEDFSQRLSKRAGYRSTEVEQAMVECGAALGLFHTAGLEEAASAADVDDIKRRLVVMARKVMAAKVVAPMDLSGKISRKYGDFAPYNIRLTDDGRVWILDQPSSHAYAPIHRDVAYFLYRVERRLGRYESDSPAEMRRVQRRFEDLFLGAYARTGPSPLDSPLDRTLFAVYLSHKHLRTARKRFDQRRYREVPTYLRMSAQWRRQLPRPK